MNYFNPNQIIYNEELPIIFLEDLMLSNESISIGSNSPLKIALNETKELVLNHNQSFFSIEYVGINQTRSENNLYAYILKGFNEKWN